MTPQPARKPDGDSSVLALQQSAGNRATTQVLARTHAGAGSVPDVLQAAGNRATAQVLARQVVKAPPPKQKPKPLTAEEGVNISADYTNAVDYARMFFGRVRDVLALRNEVHQQAISNFDKFGKLKDPPSLASAIIGEVFKAAVGLFPGGTAIKAGLSGAFFALDLAGLKKDLDASPIPGVSIEEESKRGPSDRNKARAGKYYERGKAGYDIGKGVAEKVKEVQAKQQEAAEAEASAKELAGLQSGRIAEWSTAIAKVQAQELAVKGWLKDAQRDKRHRGNVEAMVMKHLGPLPEVTEPLRRELEKHYELALYAQKLQYGTTTKYDSDTDRDISTSTPRIQLPDGEEISYATFSRITELLGVWQDWHLEAYVAEVLKLKKVNRRQAVTRYRGNRV